MLRYGCALLACVFYLAGIISATEWKPVDVVVSDVSASRITKRSNHGMPDNLHVRISGGGSDVELRLKRSTRTLELPVYLIRDGVASKVDLPYVQNAANYIDWKGRSSMIVRKHQYTNFSLDGMYVVESNETRILSNDNGTFIKNEEVDYNDDYIIRTDLNSSNTTRVKRQAVYEHTVEVLFVSDFKDFSGFLKSNHDNITMAESEMRLYYSFIADSMMLRYKTLSEGPNGDPDLKVRLLVSGLLILDNPRASHFTTGKATSDKLIAAKALDDFSDWIKRQRGLPPSDHQMLFTRYNLVRRDGSDSVAGLAVLEGLCSRMAVSVVEQSNSGSIGATAAHELAHSLGSRHDGEEIGCTDSDNYIMSAKLGNPPTDVLASRPWQFSKCSVSRIKDFLRSVTCTLKDSFYKSVIHTPYGVYPGQFYKADLQCRMALGDESYYGRYIQFRKGLDTMCRAMYCFLPGSRTTYRSVFAFEKTSCGNRKWCEKGRCVYSMYAPRTAENCPQGDDPNSDCSKRTCRYFKTKSAMAATCCGTCGAVPVVLEKQTQRREKTKTTTTDNPFQNFYPDVTNKPFWKRPETVTGSKLNGNWIWNRFGGTAVRPDTATRNRGVSSSMIRGFSSSGTTFWDNILANIGRNLFRSGGSRTQNSRPNLLVNSGLSSLSSLVSGLGSKPLRTSSSGSFRVTGTDTQSRIGNTGSKPLRTSSSGSFRVTGTDTQSRISNTGSGLIASRSWRFPGTSIDITLGSPRASGSRRSSVLRQSSSSSRSNTGNQFRMISRMLSSVMGGTKNMFSLFGGPLSRSNGSSDVQGLTSVTSSSDVPGSTSVTKKTRRSLSGRQSITIPWIFNI